MTDVITASARTLEHRDIDADFEHLREIMTGWSFRKSTGLGGEQPYYIYDYPATQELEVQEHIPTLVNQLQTMTPSDAPGDYAPKVLVMDLYHEVLEMIKQRQVLNRVLNNEQRMHTRMSNSAASDRFLKLLDNMVYGDGANLAEFMNAQYDEKKAQDEADIVFITGVGSVYPYVRAHTLLENLQGCIDDCPLVLFYPGTYATRSNTGSTMSLFSLIDTDNYYRARNLREMTPKR